MHGEITRIHHADQYLYDKHNPIKFEFPAILSVLIVNKIIQPLE